MRSPTWLFRTAAASSAPLVLFALTASASDVRARTSCADIDRASPASPESAALANVPAGIDAGDWSSIRAAFEAGRHAVSAVDDGFEAHNPGQQWSTSFDGRGFLTQPEGGSWSWGLELERYGFAGAERDVEAPTDVGTDGQRIAYDWDATLQEWWVNDTRGLEHGYVVRARPEPHAAGPLTFTLSVRGELEPRVSADGRDVRFSNGVVDVLTYSGLVVLDADGRSLAARFERTAVSELRLSIDEHGARYPLVIDPLAQQAYLKASNTASLVDFGESVSVSGDIVVVGSKRESSNATGVNGNQNDTSASWAGAAYVFVRSGASWTQEAYLKASNTDGFDWFGASVSVSGDSIVVGAPLEDSAANGVNGNESDDSEINRGAAYVFVRNGTTWTQQAYLKASNDGGHFGQAVSVSGDTIVVGANQESTPTLDAGAAYVFVRNGTSWSQEAFLKASNAQGQDEFGFAVSVSGDTIVVGAPFEDSVATGVNGNELDNSEFSSGAAYVFARSGTTWTQEAYLKASNTDTGDFFGSSVSASGDTVVVGAPQQAGLGSGLAYVFVRTGTAWSEQALLAPSNAGGFFGTSVSVSGDRALVGAPNESSSATGIDGNQSSTAASASGAAYLFERQGTTWSQQAYVKASNTGAFDHFGTCVSISGTTLAVGAPDEDSIATGVGGDQTDDATINSGAVYVFDVDPSATFCAGDGTGAACPCGNLGAIGHGCDNSLNNGGARMQAWGSTVPDTISLSSTNELPGALSIFIQGTATNGAGVPFGDGVRCVAGSLKRLYVTNALGNTASAPTAGDPSITARSAALGDPIAPGSTRYYQTYYRDPNLAFCPAPPGNSWNVSNGVVIVW